MRGMEYASGYSIDSGCDGRCLKFDEESRVRRQKPFSTVGPLVFRFAVVAFMAVDGYDPAASLSQAKNIPGRDVHQHT
jgi:hypothetical protein